jgi:hypothetical protein
MKKLLYAVMLLLSLSMMVSCGQQRSKNNNVPESQPNGSEVVSGIIDEKSIKENATSEVAANDYKWLEGVWAANCPDWAGEENCFARMIITDTYYQMVNSNQNNPSDRVEDQPKINYSIKNHYNESLGMDVFGMNEWIGIDVEERCPIVIIGWSVQLYLKKIEGSTTEAAIEIANQPQAPKIHGIIDPASYTWLDENLYDKVQSFIEDGKDMERKQDYCMVKKFDEKGKIVYYKSNQNSRYGIYPYAMEDKIDYSGYFMLDHGFMNPVHMVCYKPSDSPGSVDRSTYFNGEAIYKYNKLWQISDLYINNKTHYGFEYDNQGRVIKALKNGKPTFKITWSYYGDYQHEGYSIKFYSQEGYDAGEFKYAWKSNDVLATVYNTGKEEVFSLPEFTFYEYPRVKTLVYGRGNITCFFYNDKGRLTQVISPSLQRRWDNFWNRQEDFFVCGYTSYQYNEKGDVVSKSESELLFKKNNMTNNEFIDFLFRNNFNQLLDLSYKDSPHYDPTETIWRYEYDDHRNWTKRERYEVVHGDIDIENLKDITTRKYEYYE